MKTRDTMLGLLVIALVGAGVYLVRSRSMPAGTPMESSATAPGAQPTGSESLPDVTLADGHADTGGIRITLSLDPKPPVAFAKTRVRVRAESNGSPVAIESGRVSFEMEMPMGDHRYTLISGAEGWQEAEVVLPT